MYLADNYPNSSIKGVEINQNRANVMNNLIKKYKLDKRIEVIVADGIKYHN
jgi:tRNA1(Val) A37 N6-methylase TrmN6